MDAMRDKPFSSRVRRAIAMQKRMATAFSAEGWPAEARYVGGADAAYAPADDKTPSGRAGSVGSPGVAIAVVWDMVERRIVERRYGRRRVAFPYIPGLLTFREAPLLLAAIGRIQTPVDVWLFDGHGQSHPRRAGLATYMGMKLQRPSVGVAKGILIGNVEVKEARRIAAKEPEEPAARTLAAAPVRRGSEEIARALWRATDEEWPPARVPHSAIFISQGYRCRLEEAFQLVLGCLEGGRLPAPTRVADEWTKQVRAIPARQARQRVEGDNEGRPDRIGQAETGEGPRGFSDQESLY